MVARTLHELDVAGTTVQLTNLDKVLYPETGFTKRDVLDYYIRVSSTMLPHLRDRPLTLKRFPEGVEGPSFYQKECPPHPPWVSTIETWSETREAPTSYCVANDMPSLLWIANTGSLEFHTVLARGPKLDTPTMMVFDLDPGAPADLRSCAQVALWIRSELARSGLDAFPKTSGGKGMQVYVPLNAPGLTFDETRSFSRALALRLEQEHPDRVVSRMTKSLREGKVLVDWSQNTHHKTTVCAYSLRARSRPTVSTPLRWDEVERATRHGMQASRLVFEASAVLQRVEARGDLFFSVLNARQKLPRTPL